MRIVLLAPATVVHTRRWFHGLCAKGHHVSLVTQHYDDSLVCPSNGSIHRLPYVGVKGYFLNALPLRKLLNSIQPNIVNAHYASGYGTLASLARFRPLVLSVWGSDVFDFPYELPPLKMWLIRRVLSHADRIASTSEVMRAQVLNLVDDSIKIDITPFGVDTERFRPALFKRDDSNISIGTVKTLERKYGVDTLIRAFARISHDEDIASAGLRSKLHLTVVGDGSERTRLAALTKELNIESSTTFVGAVPHSDVPAWLNRLDIYVAVSRLDSESFGVAVIEASSCGLPVIVSDKGGLPEVVEHKITGFVSPAEDVEEIARRLKKLVLDGDLRRAMGEAGRRRVLDKYEWSACIDQMLRCYERALPADRFRATMK